MKKLLNQNLKDLLDKTKVKDVVQFVFIRGLLLETIKFIAYIFTAFLRKK